MPGYRTLAEEISGVAADATRQAALLEQSGDHQGALRMYETALEGSLAVDPVMPGFLCGRLAALYRRLERYDDEVGILELYRDSQTMESARTRFDARLSKAHAISEKKKPRDCGALASVRAIRKPAERRAASSGSARP